jgi:hypothetical protein
MPYQRHTTPDTPQLHALHTCTAAATVNPCEVHRIGADTRSARKASATWGMACSARQAASMPCS